MLWTSSSPSRLITVSVAQMSPSWQHRPARWRESRCRSLCCTSRPGSPDRRHIEIRSHVISAFRLTNNLGLLFRNHKVFNTDGGTGPSGVLVTHVHQLVSKDNRSFQTHCSITDINQTRHILVTKRAVNMVICQPVRHYFVQQAPDQSSCLSLLST